jgi:hypothetical protein
MTEGELANQDRKLSNNDSDMVLSAEDHLNAFSNEEKEKSPLEGGSDKKVESPEENDNQPEEELDENEKHQVEAKQTSENEEVEEKIDVDVEESNENKEEVNTDEEGINSPTSSPNDAGATLTPNIKDVDNMKIINDLINENSEEQNAAELSPSINKNKIELLEHLLSFVETDDELNYVLVGYFAKFFNLLINKFPNRILGYIYVEKPEILEFLLQHASKKSIADLISKILLFENLLSERDPKNSLNKSTGSNLLAHLNNPLVNNFEQINAIRKVMLTKLFKNVNLYDRDLEKITNLSLICSEVIENKNILEYVVNEPSILNHLFDQLSVDTNSLKNVSGIDIEYNYTEILNILISIVRFVLIENLKIPSYINEEDVVNSEGEQTGTLDNTMLGEYTLRQMEAILKNFLIAKKIEENDEEESYDDTLLEGTFGNRFRPLGNKRVKLVELVYCFCPYFKNVQSLFDKVLIRADFFKNSIQYFFEYEWNNFYQLNFENLLKHFLNNVNNHSEIIRHLFEELKILDIFLANGRSTNRSDTKEGFIFNSNRKINHGYFAILIELCHKIYTLPSHSLKKYFSPEWESFVEIEVVNWKKLFERKLCTPESTFVTDDFITSHHTQSSDTNADEDQKREEATSQEESEYNAENHDTNPFTNKKDMNFFNMGNESDDWLNPKKNEEESHDVLLENINDFEFVDDQRAFLQERKFSKEEEEDLLKEKNE